MLHIKNKRYLAVVVAAAASPGVFAQSSGLVLEEVVVTAEKREANLQDTAVAVTVLGAGVLEQSNIEDSLDLQFMVPNLMIAQNSNITLRGVGQSVLGGGADPAVSSSFNSMPIAPTGENYDLERIEVLRGPQGTLFGRNTTGGVINTISAAPEDEFSASLSVQLANYESVRTKGVLNLPISESVAQRFAFNTVNRDGYTENQFDGGRIDGRDELSVRSSTRIAFSDTVDMNLLIQYYNEDSDRQSSTKVACKPDPLIGCAPDTGATIGYPADYIGSIDTGLLAAGILKFNRYANHPNPEDLRTVNIDVNPVYQLEETYAGFEIDVELNDELTLTSATAYLKNKFNQFRDFDLAAAPDAFNVTPFTPGGQLTYFIDGALQTSTDYSPTQRNFRDREEFSQEFRLASNYGEGLNFLVGVSYLKTETFFVGSSYLPGLHSVLNPAFGAGLLTGGFTNQSDLESTSKAVFGEIYYDISEDLTLTAGLRYTEDEKTSVGGTNPIGDVTNPTVGRGEWDEFTGKLNLSWNVDTAFTDETLLYGTLSRGYKGGGLNPGNTFAPTFSPEFIDAIELGSKNTLLNSRMQLNTAAFYYDYSDYQVGGLIAGAAANFNAEDVSVKGLELESVYLLSENLLLNASLAFLDTEIKSSAPLPNTSLGSVNGIPRFENVEGNDLPNAPEQSISLGLQYTQELEDSLELVYRLDYYWQDKYQGREFDNYTYKSWSRADFYLTLSEGGGKWQVEAFVKNLTDDEGITGGSAEASLVGLFRKLRLLDPRTYGVEFSYRWD